MKSGDTKEARTANKYFGHNPVIILLVISIISSHLLKNITAEKSTNTEIQYDSWRNVSGFDPSYDYLTEDTVTDEITAETNIDNSDSEFESNSQTDETTVLEETTTSVGLLLSTNSDETDTTLIITTTIDSSSIGNETTISGPSTTPTPNDCKTVQLQQVLKLSATVDETTLKLKWIPPSENQHCLKEFFLQVMDVDESKIFSESSTKETAFDVKGLEPCVSYKVTVFPVGTNEKRGDEAVAFEKIPPSTPSEVKHVSYNSTSLMQPAPSTSLIVNWDKPEIAGRCVKLYQVLMWRTNDENEEKIISENVSSTSISRLDLVACEVYEMKITPIVNETLGGKYEKVVMTMQPRVTVSPSPVERGEVGSDFFDLYTDNGDTKSVCYPSIALFNCSYQGNETDVEMVKIKKLQIEKPGTTKRYTVTFEDLLPYSIYDCFAKLHNVQGWSESSHPVGRKTDEDVPGRPSNVYINDTTSNSFQVSWKVPLNPNGIIKNYRLYIKLISPLYKIPSFCNNFKKLNDSNLKADNEFTALMDDLYPYVRYSVQLAASTSKGVGDYSDTSFVDTLSAPSEGVNNFDVVKYPPTSVSEYDAVYIFKWALPCYTNGPLKGFKLKAFGDRTGYENHSLELTVPVNESAEDYKFEVKQFLPNYCYNVSLTPVTDHDDNKVDSKIVCTYAAVPKADNIEDWGYFDSKAVANPTTQVRVSVYAKVTKCAEGDINYMSILVSEYGCQENPTLQSGLLKDSTDWPEVLSWKSAQSKDCIPQYQTTPKKWNPPINTIEDGMPIRFDIGEDGCETFGVEFCNGRLKSGTKYAIIIRLFTETGYSDTQMMIFETEAMIAYEMIILTVCALLLSAFIIGLLILYKKGMFEQSPTLTILPGLDEINGKNFIDRYTEMTANKNEKIIKEYKSIDTDSTLISNHTFIAARQNPFKNRYSNIHPFDHNRVVLSTAEGDSDYINASYINGYKKDKEYVACQGPKPETCPDFWRMIMELKVEAIVMLTSFKEGNKIKCAEYFPKFEEYKYYDDVIVTCNQEIAYNSYKKRIFTVEKNNDSRSVTHYHFLKWLDHDCPKCPIDLIKFVKLVRSERKVMDVPLVVHCSAGVGRTGTFIGLDIIILKIKDEKKLSIFEIVKQLRMQRLKMVQTPGQYIYLYKCVYELMIKEKNWKQRLIEKLNRKSKEEQKEEKHDNHTLSELSPKSEHLIENGSVTTNNGESQM